MSKEIYISTTPHETRLAIIEDEQLAEIYYERENEYTLAGSIYNGKVTRVLPGMQSSFVDIGLERDAFLYVTDFMEEAGDSADFETDGGSSRKQSQPREEGGSDRGGRDRSRGRGRGGDRDRGGRDGSRQAAPAQQQPSADDSETGSFDEPVAPRQTEGIDTVEAGGEERGSRRWRGRRGRRRGRGNREEQSTPVTAQATGAVADSGYADDETIVIDSMDAYGDTTDAEETHGAIEIDLSGELAAPQERTEHSRGDRGGRGRGGRGRDRDRRGGRDRGGREASAERPAFDNSYAGYYDESALPEPTGEPIVLPGESIRKYRDPAEVAAEEEEASRNAPPKPEVLTVSTPSIEIVGWDGGAVLPGETLGRHRNRERGGDRDRSQQRVAAPVAAYTQETVVIESEDEPEVAEASAGIDAAEAAATADLGALPGELPVEEPAAEVVAEAEPVATPEVKAETEYEPEEGASAGTTDAARRDLRRFEQPSEQEPEPSEQEPETDAAAEAQVEEIAAVSPDATTYDLNAAEETAAVAHDESHEPLTAMAQSEDVAAPVQSRHEGEKESNFTTLQDSGEMLSVHVEATADEPGIPLTGQDTVSPARPMEVSEAVQSVPLSEAHTEPQPIVIGGEAIEEEVQPEAHAYGDGEFYEEEMEELEGDDFEYEASAASVEEEGEEYEEETLEGSTDFGSMLHEMSLDSHAGGEDEAEFEDASGGFTEEDFGGEGEDEEDAPAEPQTTSSNGEQRPGRGDRSRRGGRDRDRRGGRNSGGDRGRGRGRQSVQTQDLPAINELLKPGQEILVQIAKEPIAKKGARITSHIALPGRFLVFMPTVNHTGVSRKISSDEERRRLKSILLSEKGDAQGGFIVRTAADGASEEELRTDLRFLIQMWQDIKQRSESSKSPALIYHDLNLVERILRDQVTDNFSAIWVDTEQEYERVLRFLQRFQPSLVRRVKLYTKETPLFEHFGVTAEIDKALKSKVWLKSGGSIVINQTEALVAIDINTGKYVGKTARLEDTIVKTNLDAIPEIVRQIRLRDLGGIIVIDFIDMDDRKNRAKVLQALEDEMRADRAPSKILPFNDFGLVIMTRKRVKQSLERTLCIPDPVTEGTGMIKSPITVANEIYIEMRKMHRHFEKQDVMLRVHPEVVKTLKLNGAKRLQELEDMTRKTILLKSDPSLSPEAFDIH